MFTCDVTKACSFICTALTVNYRLFTHSDVPYRFNGEKDNILLDYLLTPIPLMLFTGINSMHRGNLLRILCRCCTLKLPQGAFSKLRFHLSVLNTDA